VTGLAPFVCANARDLVRRQAYYTKGDSDLF